MLLVPSLNFASDGICETKQSAIVLTIEVREQK